MREEINTVWSQKPREKKKEEEEENKTLKLQIKGWKKKGRKAKEREGHGNGNVSWRQRYTMSLVYYRAEVVNYPDSYFLSPLPHATPPPLYCLPDECLWSAKYSLLTLNCENNAHVVVLTFPMLPHLNRPGYGFHSIQGKTNFQRKRSLCSLNSWWDCW